MRPLLDASQPAQAQWIHSWEKSDKWSGSVSVVIYKRTASRSVTRRPSYQQRTAAVKEHAVALRVLDAMRQVAPDRSVDVLVKAAAAATVVSPVKLRAVHRHFEKTEELTPPKKPRMTRADPLHPLFMEGGPPLVVEQLLHKKLKEAAERNTYQSVMTLRAEVFAATGEEIPRSTMHSWVRKLGYDFGEKKLSGLTASYSAALIRRYIFDYSSMLQLEASGEFVLV